jgi:RNA polymerase-binding transcription factor DksA
MPGRDPFGVCENCGEPAPCSMVEIAPCVRIRLCADCRQCRPRSQPWTDTFDDCFIETGSGNDAR